MSKRNIYQEVTDKIIGVLDQVGAEDFEAPFAGLAAQGLPCNPVTENTYQGINIASLWCDQHAREFASNEWATFKQWQGHGAKVRKGEKGSRVIFYKTLEREEENERGEEVTSTIPVLRFYTVFNADQVDGYDAPAGHAERPDPVTRIKSVEAFCKNTGADIRHGGGRAYYRHGADYIAMPEASAFTDTRHASATENYYAVLLHELTHWTGAAHRLGRTINATTQRKLGERAFEELIAELGAAFLCAKLGISQTPRKSHAVYIKGWLEALRDDPKMVFRAAAQAGRAADYLQELRG